MSSAVPQTVDDWSKRRDEFKALMPYFFLELRRRRGNQRYIRNIFNENSRRIEAALGVRTKHRIHYGDVGAAEAMSYLGVYPEQLRALDGPALASISIFWLQLPEGMERLNYYWAQPYLCLTTAPREFKYAKVLTEAELKALPPTVPTAGNWDDPELEAYLKTQSPAQRETFYHLFRLELQWRNPNKFNLTNEIRESLGVVEGEEDPLVEEYGFAGFGLDVKVIDAAMSSHRIQRVEARRPLNAIVASSHRWMESYGSEDTLSLQEYYNAFEDSLSAPGASFIREANYGCEDQDPFESRMLSLKELQTIPDGLDTEVDDTEPLDALAEALDEALVAAATVTAAPPAGGVADIPSPRLTLEDVMRR